VLFFDHAARPQVVSTRGRAYLIWYFASESMKNYLRDGRSARDRSVPKVSVYPTAVHVLALTTLLVGASLHARPLQLQAQQFVTDDAALVEYRSCQLEAWHGETVSWLIPACQFLRNLEVSAGTGRVTHEGARSSEWLLEGKYLIHEFDRRGVGLGLVAGLTFENPSRISSHNLSGAYAYVPVSVPLAGESLVVHANLGWEFERDEHDHYGIAHSNTHHALTWALRGDLAITDRFLMIGELFSEDRLRPGYQVGLRSILMPDRFSVDVSWGGHTDGNAAGLGWTAGVAWTPAPFF
jgi:hypothetical protein